MCVCVCVEPDGAHRSRGVGGCAHARNRERAGGRVSRLSLSPRTDTHTLRHRARPPVPSAQLPAWCEPLPPGLCSSREGRKSRAAMPAGSKDLVLKTVVPAVGTVVCFFLYLAPARAVLAARRRGCLGVSPRARARAWRESVFFIFFFVFFVVARGDRGARPRHAWPSLPRSRQGPPGASEEGRRWVVRIWRGRQRRQRDPPMPDCMHRPFLRSARGPLSTCSLTPVPLSARSSQDLNPIPMVSMLANA